MEEVLIRAGSFVLIILLGFFLKRIGFLGEDPFRTVSRIVMYVTLPGAIVTNFSRIVMDDRYLLLVPCGLLCSVVYLAAARLVSGRADRTERAFTMLNSAGYNIGCFAMPYVQAFLGPTGIGCAYIFDAGNSMMGTGGNYVFCSRVAASERMTVGQMLKALISSGPFDAYLIMLTLTALRIHLPVPFVKFAGIVGDANPFMAMFMIGVGMEIRFDRHQMGLMAKCIAIRLAVSTALCALFWFFLPFDAEIRLAVALMTFAPISAVAGAFTEKLGGDVGLSNAINSIYIFFSMAAMTVVLILLR